MGLFTGKERSQIDTLHILLADAEKELEEKEQAAEQNVTALSNQLGEARKAAKHQQDAGAMAIGRLVQEHNLEIERLKGQIQALQADRVTLNFMRQFGPWHSGGSGEIDGKGYRLMEARTDNPAANFRFPVHPTEGKENI